MAHVFNLGLGMLVVVPSEQADAALAALGAGAWQVGDIVRCDGQAHVVLNSEASMKRLAVLISGNGSNLQAIVDACAAAVLPAKIVLVVSNRGAAYGLDRARQAGIPARCFPWQPYRDAGQTVLPMTPTWRSWWPCRARPGGAGRLDARAQPGVPRPLPGPGAEPAPGAARAFPGMDAIERAYEAFGRGEIAAPGVMVHWVVPEVDAGPVIATAGTDPSGRHAGRSRSPRP